MNLSQMDSATRQNSIDHLNQRWRQLYELDKDWGEKAIKYLFVTNAGGAIATLSFLGAAKLTNLVNMKIALIAFVIGVILVGVSTARTYHSISSLFKGYRKDANDFINDLVCWKYLISEDETRSKPSCWQYVIPYASFACFIFGCIIGGFSLISN